MIKNEVKLSAEFKAQTTKSIVAIFFFLITYVVIFVLTIGLTVLCVFGAFLLVATVPRLFILALGVGLASLGFLVLIFLMKFLFKSHKIDRSHLVEISEKEEPGLYQLIRQVVTEVGTSFPKRVYLTTDVNAAVFYDSNFWSMFLPIKKNLQIGLGLVNAVTREELKAILAHEFGHFSQKTMKVGSYVYNVNQVIYNMLYDNESYGRMVDKWANFSGYFTIFVVIAVKIIEVIQWVLRKMYGVVNKSYMALSREMEFHADEIAASVTGYEPLKTSLLRMDLADHSFNSVISYYNEKVTDNVKSENVYKEHGFVLGFLAKDNDLAIVNGLPKVTTEALNRFNKSKLVISDQWASHPSTEDRVARLEKLEHTASEPDTVPANDLFVDIEATQKKLTHHIFSGVKYEGEATLNALASFREEYEAEFQKNTFSKVFNGYYDSKNPTQFDLSAIDSIENDFTIDELFSEEKIDLVYAVIALKSDIEAIKQIAGKSVNIKTFDYDGKKYKKKECEQLLERLGHQLENASDELKGNDINIYKMLRRFEQENEEASQIKKLYAAFFNYDAVYKEKFEVYTQLADNLTFVNETTPFKQIDLNFIKIKPLEAQLKTNIRELMDDTRYAVEITSEMRENFEAYLSRQWQYFGHEQYNNENLNLLFRSLNDYIFILSRGYFLRKKELLGYQEDLLIKMG